MIGLITTKISTTRTIVNCQRMKWSSYCWVRIRKLTSSRRKSLNHRFGSDFVWFIFEVIFNFVWSDSPSTSTRCSMCVRCWTKYSKWTRRTQNRMGFGFAFKVSDPWIALLRLNTTTTTNVSRVFRATAAKKKQSKELNCDVTLKSTSSAFCSVLFFSSHFILLSRTLLGHKREEHHEAAHIFSPALMMMVF